MTERKLLIDVLVSQLPLGYVDSLLNGVPRLYSEADASVQENSLLGSAEKEYVRPHLLRGLVETFFREQAIKHNLNAFLASNDANTADYTVVAAGAVELTHSKTDSPNAVPVLCDFRKQRSDANNMLHQTNLFPVSSDHRVESQTYAILTHGPAKNDDEEGVFGLGYLKIGFPSPDGKSWAEPPIDLIDIKERIEIQTASNEPATTDQKLEKARQPKLKSNRQDRNKNQEGG